MGDYPEEFNPADLETKIPPPVVEAICDLLMTWPELEAVLGGWLAELLGISQDMAALFVGKMDAWTKLNKIHEVLQHTNAGQETLARVISFKAAYQDAAEIRNVLAHSPCIGVSKINPDHIYFAPMKLYKKGQPDFLIRGLFRPQLVATAIFARDGARVIRAVAQRLREERAQ